MDFAWYRIWIFFNLALGKNGHVISRNEVSCDLSEQIVMWSFGMNGHVISRNEWSRDLSEWMVTWSVGMKCHVIFRNEVSRDVADVKVDDEKYPKKMIFFSDFQRFSKLFLFCKVLKKIFDLCWIFLKDVC